LVNSNTDSDYFNIGMSSRTRRSLSFFPLPIPSDRILTPLPEEPCMRIKTW
jgi:hypothetical protein